MFDQKDIDRFWSKIKVSKEDECWIWLAGKFTNGYGRFKYNYKSYPAHIFSFMITNNIILSGRDIIIRHKCNNPPCCNPNHLIEGTHKDNYQDFIDSGKRRSKRYTYNEGIKHKESLLSEKEVKRIRYLSWWMKASEISKMPEFKNKIAESTIRGIINYRSWKHIK